MEDVKARLRELSDDDVLELLDVVSEEVKRRNSLHLPAIPPVGTPEFDGTIRALADVFSSLKPVKDPDRRT